MSGHKEPSGDESFIPAALKKKYIRLSQADVARIHSRRMQYLFAYFCLCAIWVVAQALVGGGHPLTLLLQGIGIVLLFFFYHRFVYVLRAMGYRIILILPLCVLVLAPIPGLLVVLVLDRSFAKALRGAQPDPGPGDLR